MATSTKGQQYWHAPVRCGRSNVRDMEGLAASVLLTAILLGVLLVVGRLCRAVLRVDAASTEKITESFDLIAQGREGCPLL